jgi:uncharacterized protein YcbK (DUF882 family)
LEVKNPNNDPIPPDVYSRLEQFNDYIGQDKDIIITGGNRSSNSKLGAKSKSTHAKGQAADVRVPGQCNLQTANQADQSDLFGGIGWYEEGYRGPNGEGPHVHVDIRQNRARWGYDKEGKEYHGSFPKY